MGGTGSGRRCVYDTKPTTNQYLSIDARHWKREGLLTPGMAFSFQWKRSGCELGAMEVQVEPDSVILTYRYHRPRSEAEGNAVRYPIYLEWTACHFGGERPWFLCPGRGCGRRVAILYAGPYFTCRKCLKLAYCSQREDEIDRKNRKLRKVRAQLGVHDPTVPIWLKPKGMHYRTFERLLEEERKANRAANAAFAEAIDRITRHSKR